MSSKKGKVKEGKGEEDYIRGLFDLVDTDNDKTITGKEIMQMFQLAGFIPTEKELKDILTTADKDENESITFDEFLNMMQTTTMPRDAKEKQKELSEAFKMFDKNKDGVIDKKEFEAVLSSGGTSADEIKELMKQFDTNGDGKLQYTEFVEMMTSSDFL